MVILRSLLIALLVGSFANAQESDKSLPKETGLDQIAPAEINGSSLAALEAVREGNDLWRSGEVEQSSVSYQRAIDRVSGSPKPPLCTFSIQLFKDDGPFARQGSLHYTLSRSSRGRIQK